MSTPGLETLNLRIKFNSLHVCYAVSSSAACIAATIDPNMSLENLELVYIDRAAKYIPFSCRQPAGKSKLLL